MRAPRPFRPPSGARRASGGFTLLEITVAMLIFFLIVTFAFWSMSDAVDQALAAEQARRLRMLADRKLGEVAVFEQEFDPAGGADEGDFDDLPDELRDLYEGWTWEIEVRDVTVFGLQKDQNAPYLFPDSVPSTEETAAGGTGTSSGTSSGSSKKGETQLLRELRLRVAAPASEDGGEGDAIEVVTYLPPVAAKAAPAAPSSGGNR